MVLTGTGVVTLAIAVTAAPKQPPQPSASQAGRLPVTRSVGLGVPTAHGASPALRPVGPVMSRSQPVALDIASVDVHTALMHLGLTAAGSLQAPSRPLLAGWYTGSATPGQPGPAVIAGHVDSWETGPAVFYKLGELGLGRAIVVTRADGSRAIFTVDAVREYSKAAFPTQAVYGDTARAELRLITCGDWDAAHQQYDGNTVVFAHLVSSIPAG